MVKKGPHYRVRVTNILSLVNPQCLQSRGLLAAELPGQATSSGSRVRLGLGLVLGVFRVGFGVLGLVFGVLGLVFGVLGLVLGF